MKKVKMLSLLPALLMPALLSSGTQAAAVAKPVVKPVETLNLTGANMTLRENFLKEPEFRAGGTMIGSPVKPLNDPSFSWAAGYVWNHAIVGSKITWPPQKTNFPAWTSNNGNEASPNGDMLKRIDPKYRPLKGQHGLLYFTARPMPAELKKTVSSQDPNAYLSGTITSYPYAQQYGVFVINAMLPKGKGLWPAFWLLPHDLSWPPEIDIFEVLGADTKTVYATAHWRDLLKNNAYTRAGGYKRLEVDLSAGFHEYALDWGPDEMKWYIDRKLYFRAPTPPQLKKPCYILTNLAVGRTTSWGGAPDSKTMFPSSMRVDYIYAYQRPAYMNK